MEAGLTMLVAIAGLILAQSAGINLPDSPCPGWKAEPQSVIKPSGLFDYMDGAGELYLAYNMKELTTREYTKDDQPRITCEVYEMPGSADAFGLFTQDRTGKQLKIGQGAVYSSGLLIGWQGKYFIRILTERETAETKQCITELAKQVAKLCGQDGKPPAALSWLPKEGLDPLSVHYFHTHTVLNYFHFLSSDNILNLSSKTEAAMGSYTSPKGKSLVLVIGYPSETDCSKAWESYRKTYLKELKLEGAYHLAKLENGKWTGGITQGKKLILILESPTREAYSDLIKAIQKKGGR